jgi:hypothetical protein
VSHQTAITRDNVTITIDGVLYVKVRARAHPRPALHPALPCTALLPLHCHQVLAHSPNALF